jgi:CheY-like chemotaxis protein
MQKKWLKPLICRNNPDTDLILMDVKNAENEGYEATRKIRQFNRNVVILCQAADGLASDKEQSYRRRGCQWTSFKDQL